MPLALFLAYVVSRAVGILLGIGPYATEAIAIVVVLVLIWAAGASPPRKFTSTLETSPSPSSE